MTKEQRLILIDRFAPAELLGAVRHIVRLEGKGWEPISPSPAPEKGAIRCTFHLVKVSGGNVPGGIVMTKTTYNGAATALVHSEVVTPANVKTLLQGLCDQPGNDALFVRLFGAVEARSVFLNKLELYTLQDLEGAVNRIDALLSVLDGKTSQREIDLVAEEAHRECLFTGPVTHCRKSFLEESLASFRETALLATSKRASIAELLGESTDEARSFLSENEETVRQYGYVFACTRSFLIHSGLNADEAMSIAFGQEDARLQDGVESKEYDFIYTFPVPDKGVLLKEALNQENLAVTLEMEWSALVRSVMVDGPGFIVKERQALPTNINGNPYRGAQLMLLALAGQRSPELGSCWLSESQMRQLGLPVSQFAALPTIAGGLDGNPELRKQYNAREVFGSSMEMPRVKRNAPAPDVYCAAKALLQREYPSLPTLTTLLVQMQMALLTGVPTGPIHLTEQMQTFLTDRMSPDMAARHILDTGQSLVGELMRAGAICARLEKELLLSVTLESQLAPIVEAAQERMSQEEVSTEIEL